MSDLISRQVAIKAIEDLQDCYNGFSDTFDKACIIGVLEELPPAQPEQRWIPCSERLPENIKKKYWVCTNTRYQCECRWTNNLFGIRERDEWGWSVFDTPQFSEVVAWMPLPEPYKEGE